MQWGEIINKSDCPTDILYIRNVFTESECKNIINTCEKHNDWKEHYNDKATNVAPGKECRIAEADKKLALLVVRTLYSKCYPIVSKFWPWARLGKPRRSFVVKYSHDIGQTAMTEHVDSSYMSFSVPLNDNYAGGGLYFPRQYVNTEEHLNVGDSVCWFGGSPLYPHSGMSITSGTRFTLVSWWRDSRDKENFDMEEGF